VTEVVRQCHVAADAATVWALVSELQAMSRWYPQARRVEKLDGPDTGVGRVQRVRFRQGGRNAAIDTEVVVWEPPHRIAWRQLREFLGTKQAPLLARNVVTSLQIEPERDGCRVRFWASWQPVGLKGELALETVLRPRTAALADGIFTSLSELAAGVREAAPRDDVPSTQVGCEHASSQTALM
jgi:uncharacterized protein YndB with AHSA1/START domain